MKLENSNIIVEFDSKTGATASIVYPQDQTSMNWVLNNSNWGIIEGFETVSIENHSDKIIVTTQNQRAGLKTTIEKIIDNNAYYEKYIIENINDVEFFLTKDNFGIPLFLNCHYERGCDLMSKCVSHLWCGGDVCWMYSARTNGDKPYLVMNLTEGEIDDYSITYDISRVQLGADWRGGFLLHPRECILKPEEKIELCFRYRFSDVSPENMELDFGGAMRFSSDKYTVYKGEKLKLKLEYIGELKNTVIRFEDDIIPHTLKNGFIECEYSFDTIGEKEITAETDGKFTFIKINVIPDIDNLLEKRAHFIAEKQQYHSEDSRLDGAYLIYDPEKDGLYFGRIDHNAGRERIGMGITVCRALQKKYSPVLMESLKKHRLFVERELFDENTGIVYNDVGRSNKYPRIYNYPWFSVYYLEWYRLTGERKCIINSANILLEYYKQGGKIQDSQNISIVEITECLEKEGLTELKEKMIECIVSHAESIIERSGITISKEVTWVNELPNCALCYLSQAYILTGEKKYINMAERYYRMSEAFFGHQPDFHLNCVTVRYWDDYWFGKIKSYGDVFPHYWSILTGWALYWYDKARKTEENREIIYNNLTGNLCVYRENGYAANCYLYPYKIELYSSNPAFSNQFLKPGITYGKRYEPWSNDQDWSIYYASLLLK